MDKDFPLPQNINIASGVAMLVWVLAMFHIVIPPDISNDLIVGLPPLLAVVVFILHTFVNHPANIAKAKAMVRKYGGRMAPMVFAMIMLPGLMSCSSVFGKWFGGGYSASQNELNAIAEGTTIGNDALQLLAVNCVQMPNPTWSGICSKKLQIKQAAAAYVASVGSIDALVKTQNASPSAVDALITALAQDAAVIAALEAGTFPKASSERCTLVLQSDGSVVPVGCPAGSGKKSAVDITYIIQIVTQLIPVAIEVFQQIQALLAATPTVATIDGLYTAAQTDAAAINAW